MKESEKSSEEKSSEDLYRLGKSLERLGKAMQRRSSSMTELGELARECGLVIEFNLAEYDTHPTQP